MEDGNGQIAENRVRRVGHVERVAIDPVLNAAGAGAEEGLQEDGQSRLSPVHSSVQEPDGGRDLPAQNRADQQPAEVALDVAVSHGFTRQGRQGRDLVRGGQIKVGRSAPYRTEH